MRSLLRNHESLRAFEKELVTKLAVNRSRGSDSSNSTGLVNAVLLLIALNAFYKVRIPLGIGDIHG